jgi:hypothetical protein
VAKLKDDFGLTSSPDEAGQDQSVFLFISLYSLLLAFFILLYTYATYSKNKAEVVSGSVKQSFQKGIKSNTPDDNAPVALSPFGEEMLLAPPYGEIRRVAKELLAIDDASIVEKGDKLILRLPVALLFVEGSAEVDDRKLFLQNMADSVTTAPLGLQLDIEFKMPRLPNMKTADRLLVHRSGAFARLLAQMGIPENTIYVGISEGKSEMIEITFSPRNVSKTKLEFLTP